MNPKRNRKDHYIPRSFLRGFIDPSRWILERPLWYFDVPNKTWSERSPGEIGYRYGFYDYATTAELGMPTADETFAALEGRYPRVRRSLVENNFQNWKEHLDFLLRYAQMMRARSLLFFKDKTAEWSRARGLVVEEVLPDGKSVRVKSITPEPLPEGFIRNRVIVEMRDEIQKGAAWLKFNWCLRYCDSPFTPFVISEIPLVSLGSSSDLAEALRAPETLLFFPLCWQACLIGSRQFFEKETDRFEKEEMLRTQRVYRDGANLFVLSPQKLDLYKRLDERDFVL